MKATSNAETEFAMGREPIEMSRPAITTRSGVSPLIHTLYILDSPILLDSVSSWSLGLVYTSS
jgi:hypothetical protein